MNKADKTVSMYEKLFQVRLAKNTASGDTKDKELITKLEGAFKFSKSLRKQGSAAIQKEAIIQKTGFRIVDADSFVIGLNDTTCYWLGNGNLPNHNFRFEEYFDYTLSK